MAALDFPDNPSTGTTYDKWTWNGSMWVFTNGVGAGYTFVQEFTPIPTKQGDTWFDTSTTAAGGTSWVAVLEGAAGSELVWVQTSPGIGGQPQPWNVAWGRMADMASIDHTIPVSALTDSGYTLTFTIVAGRRYRIWFHGMYQGTVVGDLVSFFFAGPNNNTHFCEFDATITAAALGPVSMTHEFWNQPAGPATFKIRMQRTTGTGTVKLIAGINYQATFCVEDIGPVDRSI